ALSGPVTSATADGVRANIRAQLAHMR
ncbi:MAG: hypothetical protein JWM66_1743, partial [Solirubrobacterales bacterium]|nr:hypothetical protein [Solirubrobacterales bacterium]